MVDFKSNMIVQVATRHIRSILNGAMSRVTPGDIVAAIKGGQSIWGGGESEIRKYSGRIPGAETFGRSLVSDIEREYGSVTALVVMWLQEDQSMKYSMIMNTPGGVEWLDRQVNEILCGMGLKDGM